MHLLKNLKRPSKRTYKVYIEYFRYYNCSCYNMGVVLINYRKRGIDMSLFRVAIHYGVNSNGFLSYDTETKTVSVDLPEQEWVDKVIAYLNNEHAIEHATGLDTYERLTVKPLESLDNLKLALTRMWEAIDVQVDWSRPA